MSRLDTKDRLVAVGTVAGVVCFGLLSPAFGLVFLSAVAFGLLALHLFTEARS